MTQLQRPADATSARSPMQMPPHASTGGRMRMRMRGGRVEGGGGEVAMRKEGGGGGRGAELGGSSHSQTERCRRAPSCIWPANAGCRASASRAARAAGELRARLREVREIAREMREVRARCASWEGAALSHAHAYLGSKSSSGRQSCIRPVPSSSIPSTELREEGARLELRLCERRGAARIVLDELGVLCRHELLERRGERRVFAEL